MAKTDSTSTNDNQHRLVGQLARVRAALERHTAAAEGYAASGQGAEQSDSFDAAGPQTTSVAPEPLRDALGLSPFEWDIVLLCAGVDLDATFAGLCAAAHGDPARPYPTLGLALAALDDPHWSALTPEAPLRRWRLIEVVGGTSTPLTVSPLRIDERILHFLVGIEHLDERLVGLVEPVRADAELVDSHRALAAQIAATWTGVEGPLPIVGLCGGDNGDKQAIAAAGCAALGLRLWVLDATAIPVAAAEREGLIRLWEREAVLAGCALYIDAGGIDQADANAVIPVMRLLNRCNGPLIMGTRDRWRLARRPIITLNVRKPERAEQQAVWRALLGEAARDLNGHVEHLAAQFDLSVPAIRAAVRDAQATAPEGDDLAARLWDAGRAQARPRLDDLAQRISSAASWDDLVLPEAEQDLLHEIGAHVAHRIIVYDRWGFGARGSRGLGISALFAGASGTGKTMAAEVLANELQLDLYRIDLSSVVSKYIGETEKNLRRVFDAAEDGGTILFFDEADALFGKRSEVRDSHDRYANIEVNYLLQRMEAYRGLAVLATNMKSALDTAFLRRLRFVVNFPFPDMDLRIEIWRRVFPLQTPTEGLDLGKLARLNVAGGNIRNIALNAAFLAAGTGEPVRMTHLLRAARSEYAKIEKPLTPSEIGGWV